MTDKKIENSEDKQKRINDYWETEQKKKEVRAV